MHLLKIEHLAHLIKMGLNIIPELNHIVILIFALLNKRVAIDERDLRARSLVFVGCLGCVVEHFLFELINIRLPIASHLSLETFFHFLLCFVVESLYLINFINIEYIVITNFLEEFEKKRSLRLRPPLRNPLIEVRIQIRFLHYLPNNISIPNRLHIQIMALRKLRILDPLLSQRKLEHFYSPDQVIVNVLLRLQLSS